MSNAPSSRKLLTISERTNIVVGAFEDAMTKLQTARSPKQQERVRVELRKEIERLVRGRGRDVLQLVRQFTTEAADTFEVGEAEAFQSVSAVPLDSLLAVIDAGFMAEDDAAVGERCPLCERLISEHTRADLYGTDAVVCLGSPRDAVVVGHPQALSNFVAAATREAQRQFDELTKGSEARTNAEDYAAIMDVVAALPEEQFSGIAYEGGPIAGVVAELLKRGPVLDKTKLLAVFRDGIAAAFNEYDIFAEQEIREDITQAAEMLANLLKAIFPVRVEYLSMEAVERVEKARKEPAPPLPLLTSDQQRGVILPPMQEGQTHWLIGGDYGLYYKIDAEGRVTRLENEYTSSEEGKDVPDEGHGVGRMGREYSCDRPDCIIDHSKDDIHTMYQNSEEAEGSPDDGAGVGLEPASSE